MKIIRLHPYNRQVIIFNRWRQNYAPAYGWKAWLRGDEPPGCVRCGLRTPDGGRLVNDGPTNGNYVCNDVQACHARVLKNRARHD